MADLAAKRNIPVVVNIHNVVLAKRFCGRMIGMTEGRVVFDGGPTQLTDAKLNEIYGGENWIE